MKTLKAITGFVLINIFLQAFAVLGFLACSFVRLEWMRVYWPGYRVLLIIGVLFGAFAAYISYTDK